MLSRICPLLIAATSVLVQCGGEPKKVDQTTTPDPAWTAIAPVITANCGKCHPNFTSAAVFNGSKAKAKLTAGAMPPAPNQISADDKAKILAYLQ